MRVGELGGEGGACVGMWAQVCMYGGWGGGGGMTEVVKWGGGGGGGGLQVMHVSEDRYMLLLSIGM